MALLLSAVLLSTYMLAKSVLHQKCPVIHKVERAEMSIAGWIITP